MIAWFPQPTTIDMGARGAFPPIRALASERGNPAQAGVRYYYCFFKTNQICKFSPRKVKLIIFVNQNDKPVNCHIEIQSKNMFTVFVIRFHPAGVGLKKTVDVISSEKVKVCHSSDFFLHRILLLS